MKKGERGWKKEGEKGEIPVQPSPKFPQVLGLFRRGWVYSADVGFIP